MIAQILAPTPENIAIASEAIQRGEVVGMPTETVYGLAGDAFNPVALARIFATKERPTFDPLIVHVSLFNRRVADLERAGLVDAKRLSPLAQERANALMTAFWPGPLTLVLPKTDRVPDLATSGLSTVALRMPRHPVAQALITSAQTPLAAPSANRFGRISPTSAPDVFEELGDRIDFILDGGRCEVGIESTIISVSENGGLKILRPGGLSVEKIEAAVGSKIVFEKKSIEAGVAAPSPGMLESHYAPKKNFLLLSDSLENLVKNNDASAFKNIGEKKTAILIMVGDPNQAADRFQKITGICPQVFVLSAGETLMSAGALEKAAQNLFHLLREMDRSDAEILLAEPCPIREGLGFAIGDRLSRASAKREE